eukprot:127984-Amphidinium_carterae.1
MSSRGNTDHAIFLYIHTQAPCHVRCQVLVASFHVQTYLAFGIVAVSGIANERAPCKMWRKAELRMTQEEVNEQASVYGCRLVS